MVLYLNKIFHIRLLLYVVLQEHNYYLSNVVMWFVDYNYNFFGFQENYERTFKVDPTSTDCVLQSMIELGCGEDIFSKK